jgi:hypothetical protein
LKSDAILLSFFYLGDFIKAYKLYTDLVDSSNYGSIKYIVYKIHNHALRRYKNETAKIKIARQ